MRRKDGFNLSLISVRAGNGGTCDNPRAQTLLTSFVVTVRAQRPGRARRWRAVEQFRDSVAPRRRRRLAIFYTTGFTSTNEW